MSRVPTDSSQLLSTLPSFMVTGHQHNAQVSSQGEAWEADRGSASLTCLEELSDGCCGAHYEEVGAYHAR